MASMTVLGIVVYTVGFSHPNNGIFSGSKQSSNLQRHTLLGILGQVKGTVQP